VRIALISTPFVSVPPSKYGGTELVVAELVHGLSKDHDVTLFATGDSKIEGCQVEALMPAAVWPPEPYAELSHAAWAMGRIVASEFDVIHAHVPAAVAFAPFTEVPMVYTMHHERERPLIRFYSHHLGRFTPVAISRRQCQVLLGRSDCQVVHHGLDVARYPAGPGGDSVSFLGRLSPEKGPHLAIDAARAAGRRIRVGGKPHWKDGDFFDREMRGRLAERHVEYLGEVGHEAKTELLGTSAATLCPIQWEEPFGLVLIEAMLCGTPPVSLPMGSAPELIEHGVTGFLARDVADMARILRDEVPRFDRHACRERAARQFSRERMVRDYLQVYERASQRSSFEEHVILA
jgi:glycosyltransferase involved in cell wall biosynthesis